MLLDVLCYGLSFEDHLKHLELVLKRLKAKGIKLKPDKCNFFKREGRYLGRRISGEGYRPDPKDTAALEKFRCPPKDVGELRSLLGFLGYYRSFVKDIAKKMKPLYDLLKLDADQKVKQIKVLSQKHICILLSKTNCIKLSKIT